MHNDDKNPLGPLLAAVCSFISRGRRTGWKRRHEFAVSKNGRIRLASEAYDQDRQEVLRRQAQTLAGAPVMERYFPAERPPRKRSGPSRNIRKSAFSCRALGWPFSRSNQRNSISSESVSAKDRYRSIIISAMHLLFSNASRAESFPRREHPHRNNNSSARRLGA